MPRHLISLRDFMGRWTIIREIRDQKNGTRGRLDGQAVFRAQVDDPEILTYEERGQLQMDGGTPIAAERRYQWRQIPESRSIDIQFADGRPFHKLDLNCTMPFDTHFCEPDVYNVSYDFRSWPVWRCEWRVQGPRKDYRMWSRYRFMGHVSQAKMPCAATPAEAQRAPNSMVTEGESSWRSTVRTES